MVTIIKIIVVFCWVGGVAGFIRFIGQTWKQENKKTASLVFLVFMTAVMLCTELYLPVRSGYDTGDDFDTLSYSFFETSDFYFKEIAPVFTIWISDIISVFSLKAILWQNRILSVLSLFLLYFTLRRLKLTFSSSITGCVLLFFNFNMLMSAQSMATTLHIVFFLLCSVSAAVFSFHNTFSLFNIIWFFTASTVLLFSRAELMPVPFFFFVSSLINHIFLCGNIKFLFSSKKRFISVLTVSITGVLFWIIGAVKFFSYNPEKTFSTFFAPYENSLYQLILNNFAVLFTWKYNVVRPEYHPVFEWYMHICYLITMILIVAGFVLLIKYKQQKKNLNEILFIIPALILAFISNSIMYNGRNWYPVQFIRHHVMFFIPCIFIAAYACEGYRLFFENSKKEFLTVLCFVLSAYSCSSIVTAFAMNKELRANDMIWELLVRNQKKIRGKYYVDTQFTFRFHANIIEKYFNRFIPDSRKILDKKLYFISPEKMYYDLDNGEKIKFLYPILAERFLYKDYLATGSFMSEEFVTEYGFYKEIKSPFLNNIISKINRNNAVSLLDSLLKAKEEAYDFEFRTKLFILFMADINYNIAKKKLDEIKYCLNENEYIRLSNAVENIRKDKGHHIYDLVKMKNDNELYSLYLYMVSIYQNPLIEI